MIRVQSSPFTGRADTEFGKLDDALAELGDTSINNNTIYTICFNARGVAPTSTTSCSIYFESGNRTKLNDAIDAINAL